MINGLASGKAFNKSMVTVVSLCYMYVTQRPGEGLRLVNAISECRNIFACFIVEHSIMVNFCYL